MIGRLTAIGTLALVAAIAPAQAVSPANAAGLASAHGARLIVEPTEGHAGDSVYVSGGGFKAREQISLTFDCGGKVRRFTGFSTTAKGSFVGFRTSVPSFGGKKRARCNINAVGSRSRKVHVGAQFEYIPPSQVLTACARRMCLKLTAVLVRTRTGAQGNVIINAWPGAVAYALVVYPGGKLKYKNIHIGWQGGGAIRIRIAHSVKGAIKAGVYVKAALGSMSGATATKFIVLGAQNR